MEFRIRHTSNLFRFSILLPWAVLFAGAALFGILNLFLKDDVQRAEVFLVLLLLCIGLDVLYLVLFFSGEAPRRKDHHRTGSYRDPEDAAQTPEDLFHGHPERKIFVL